MVSTRPDFLLILQTLAKHDVDFIIVGGVCAVLHGAPISTFDLGLVHSREPDNVDRLLAALEELETVYRAQGSRLLRPQKSDLMTAGHHLLMTRGGPLDILGAIGRERGYGELLEHCVAVKLGEDLAVRLLKLEILIETKKEAGRDKDNAVLSILQRTLEESLK
jgi:hypothetical protein